MLGDDSGIAMFPATGSAIMSEYEDITGSVEQECIYRFFVIYRAAGLSEQNKSELKEWLDNLGRWLEGQSISKNGTAYKLSYPELTDSRKIKTIRRESQAYLDSENENKSENWAISLSARYTNKFERNES